MDPSVIWAINRQYFFRWAFLCSFLFVFCFFSCSKMKFLTKWVGDRLFHSNTVTPFHFCKLLSHLRLTSLPSLPFFFSIFIGIIMIIIIYFQIVFWVFFLQKGGRNRLIQLKQPVFSWDVIKKWSCKTEACGNKDKNGEWDWGENP